MKTLHVEVGDGCSHESSVRAQCMWCLNMQQVMGTELPQTLQCVIWGIHTVNAYTRELEMSHHIAARWIWPISVLNKAIYSYYTKQTQWYSHSDANMNRPCHFPNGWWCLIWDCHGVQLVPSKPIWDTSNSPLISVIEFDLVFICICVSCCRFWITTGKILPQKHICQFHCRQPNSYHTDQIVKDQLNSAKRVICSRKVGKVPNH